MTSSPLRRAAALFTFAALSAVSAAGCSKKEPPPAQNVETPPPPPSSAPTVTELAPLTDDGGPDGEADAQADAAKPAYHAGSGPGVSANQSKVKACCNAMRTQVKALGNSPEATTLNGFVAACDALATQVGGAGSDPAFNQLRTMLKVVKLPNLCQF
jgi:hypothetical protein